MPVHSHSVNRRKDVTTCRHSHTTASAPGAHRPRNAYVREDAIVPHLPALHLLLTGTGTQPRRRRTRGGTDVRLQVTAEDVIAYLREQQLTVTYEPAAGTLHAGTGQAAQTITLTARD
jgi:site-specific DNA recombinase